MNAAETSIFAMHDAAGAVVSRDGVDLVPPGVHLDLSGLDPCNFSAGGYFVVECVDENGNIRWEDTAENGVTDAGIAHILNVVFLAQTQVPNWYIGVVDNAGFTQFASGDTMSSHAGWSEIASASYSNANRVAWGPGAPSGGAITNAATANYNMTPAGSSNPALTVKGLFLVSDNTKGGTTGVLMSTAAFTQGTQGCNNGDTLRISYVMAAQSS